jgi:hypothetical protein
MDFHFKSAPLILLNPAVAEHYGCHWKPDEEVCDSPSPAGGCVTTTKNKLLQKGKGGRAEKIWSGDL